MAAGAKEFRYTLEQNRTGRLTADGSSPLDLDGAWTPEHLVLAGLVRCTFVAQSHKPIHRPASRMRSAMS
jgi:hypothetical protein